MIHPQCFTKEWFRRHAEALDARNPVMLEKAIVALQLLGPLAETGLPIQFKGGTSLLLRLNPIRRLSIDVDIVTQARPDELLAALARVGKLTPLAGHEHDAQRDKELPPKKHFRFFYPSANSRQLVYRQAKFSLADTLNDSIEAGFLYSQLGLRGGTKTEQGLLLQDGVAALANHLVNQPFRHDEARIAAGKVACVAAWIQRRPDGVTIEQLRFQPSLIAELHDLQIQASWTPLNRLKGANAQAFHYWYQAQRVLTGGLTR